MRQDASTTTTDAGMLDHPPFGAQSVTGPLEELMRRLGAHAVFGDPVEKGTVTVIPVAEVRGGLGFGFGEGRARKKQDEEGSGGGAGARFRVVPRGYLTVREEGARFQPIRQMRTLILAGMTLAAWGAWLAGRSAGARSGAGKSLLARWRNWRT